MAEFQLMLTSDYEVWGDGSGCVEKCVIEPTQAMMDIAERHDAKITFFLDVCEFWAFEKLESEGRFTNNYRPATLMKQQLKQAILNGHDVQLHFHPQWLNYTFNSNYSWDLDQRYWKLPEVKYYHNGDWSIEKLFKEGIQTLNTMFKSVDPKYKVVAFRAGGWCIQPEENIIKAMVDSGIQVDSTVASGRKNLMEPYSYDYTSIPSLPYWQVGKKITQNGNEKLLELPICTSELSIMDKINFKFQKLKYRSKFLPAGCVKRLGKKGEKLKLKSFQKSIAGPWMLNYSDGTTYSEMRKITELYMMKFVGTEKNPVPIVAISHPKTFGVRNEFERFLDWINEHSNISKETISTWMDKMKNTE